MFVDTRRTPRLLAGLLLPTLLASCAPVEMAPLEEDPDAPLGVTIDGVPVDCTRTTTFETGATPSVAVSGEAASFAAALDGVDVQDRFEGDAPARASLGLEADRPATLTVERIGGSLPFRCDVRLVHRPASEAGVEALRAASRSEATFTWSSETGAVSGGIVDVPAESAEAFLAEHADALGVLPSSLREIDRWDGVDGWVTVVFEQVFEGEVQAFEASLEVELDPEGTVRTFHARLFPGLDALPPFSLDASQALAIVGEEVGEVESFRRVVHDAAAPRAGWVVIGDAGLALVDDAEAALRFVDPVILEAPMELHRPNPDPLLDTRRGAGATTLVARGDTTTGIPSSLSSGERDAWSVNAAIAGQVQRRLGNVGWLSNRLVIITQSTVAESRSGGTGVAGAFYEPGRGRMFLDGQARGRPETICHEYGHAFDDRFGGTGAPTFAETMGDVFYLFCEPWVNPRGRRYSYNESARRHDVPTGRADQHDYDAFRALGIRESAIGRGAQIGGRPIVTHDHAFLVTLAFHAMMENHGLPLEKATTLGFGAAAGTYGTFPELRDRVVRDAVSWARSGRSGFTSADACAVAQGFRATNLDGEYGTGAGCSESERAELVCTANHCPICGDTAPATVCRPETLTASSPTCDTADGRRTCVGSIAASPEGCASGQSHLCWCVGDGRWDCSTARACEPSPSARTYCPEDPGPSRAGAAAPTCSASAAPIQPGAAGGAAGLPLLALALIAARRRRR